MLVSHSLAQQTVTESQSLAQQQLPGWRDWLSDETSNHCSRLLLFTRPALCKTYGSGASSYQMRRIWP